MRSGVTVHQSSRHAQRTRTSVLAIAILRWHRTSSDPGLCRDSQPRATWAVEPGAPQAQLAMCG